MKKESSTKQSLKSPTKSASTRAFVKTIRSLARRYNAWKYGDKIVLAVSGGCDSMVMLDFFVSICKKENVSLCIAHVNYGLRGASSDSDEQLVCEYGKKHSVEVFIHRVHNAPKDEASLREIRFQFFETVRKKMKFDLIALAHHRDDQAETVLFRFLRGSGRLGLSAMSVKRDTIIRPFLFVPRSSIRTYAQTENIPFRDDESNFKGEYARNRIRHEILPSIRERINPNIDETLTNMALVLADEEVFLEKELTDTFFFIKNEASVNFSLAKWRALPEALQRRAIRKTIFSVFEKEIAYNISFSMVEEIRFALLSSKSKCQKCLFHDLIVERKGDTVQVRRECVTNEDIKKTEKRRN